MAVHSGGRIGTTVGFDIQPTVGLLVIHHPLKGPLELIRVLELAVIVAGTLERQYGQSRRGRITVDLVFTERIVLVKTG